MGEQTRVHVVRHAVGVVHLAVPHHVHPGLLAHQEFPSSAPAAARATQTWRYPPFFLALLDAGVYPPCSAFETWFVSTALDGG
ncbi:hypothetical protein MAHJHV55_52250 [Mycobacterium avium subsp. hominissuis]